MKLCARCGREWPVDGNFCPIDGCELVPIPDEVKSVEAPLAGDQAPIPDPGTAVDESLGDVGWDEPEGEKIQNKPARKMSGGREFSETQWFMLGADPESLVDNADKDDLENLQDKYGRDSSIPTDERKKYTLRGQEKLPDGEAGEDGGES
ncbi:MAG: hypothetical protein ABIK09_08700 [Pseudomonadota bacterium]